MRAMNQEKLCYRFDPVLDHFHRLLDRFDLAADFSPERWHLAEHFFGAVLFGKSAGNEPRDDRFGELQEQ